MWKREVVLIRAAVAIASTVVGIHIIFFFLPFLSLSLYTFLFDVLSFVDSGSNAQLVVLP